MPSPSLMDLFDQASLLPSLRDPSARKHGGDSASKDAFERAKAVREGHHREIIEQLKGRGEIGMTWRRRRCTCTRILVGCVQRSRGCKAATSANLRACQTRFRHFGRRSRSCRRDQCGLRLRRAGMVALGGGCASCSCG